MSPLYAPLAIALLYAASASAAEPKRFYVAPDGDNHWSGMLEKANPDRTDGPLASLSGARDALRHWKAARQGLSQPVEVVVAGGIYRLSETLTFTPEDSGTAACPITYKAAAGQRPVISGGRRIGGWQRGKGALWTAQLPEVVGGKWYFHQLFVNGQRRTRARTPNEGYLRTGGTLMPLVRDRAKAPPESRLGFRYQDGDLTRFRNLDDVNLVVYHAWTASWHHIQSVDEAARTVRFTNPSGWPIGWWEKEQRYVVENAPEALDAAGEWYLDRRTGVLSYWPMPGEDVSKAEVVAPALRTLVELAGRPEESRYVEHLRLAGLALEHTDWDFDRTKPADGQAAVFLGAAVSANGARSCWLENCELAHLGEYAVMFNRGCQSNRVEQCHLYDLGAGGVRIGEPARIGKDLPQQDRVRTAKNVVHNNFIHDGGHVFPAGIGVWVGQSADNRIDHNEVCDFRYSGMSLGWTWGYGPSEARGNVVEFNHIHHIGLGVLSDLGGIYTLGIQPGTVLRNNVIHDVLSYSYGGWGLYTDEGSQNIVLENNVVYRTKTGGFHQHYGRENIVRNNVFALAAEPQIIRSRQEEHISFTFERNIVYQDRAPLLGGNWGNRNFRMDYNDYWRVRGEMELAGMPLDEWQESTGQDRHSVVADPKFVAMERDDFRVQPDSPALRLGFRNIDTSRVGLVGEKAWVEAPRKITRPPTVFEEWKDRGSLDEGFETTAVGQPPEGARVSGADAPASVAVTEETAATGKRSLKIVDAAGLPQVWQPHFYYDRIPLARGRVVVSFNLRVEKGAVVGFECRDAERPYHAGPSLSVDGAGQLRAGRKPLVLLPHGKWTHLEISLTLGKASPGTYDLAVTLADGQKKQYAELPLASREFRRLNWLGFMSNATGPAVYYVDNIRLARQAGDAKP